MLGSSETRMTDLFFERPILNSPYVYPGRHWELDAQGQPTQQIIEKRRRAEQVAAGRRATGQPSDEFTRQIEELQRLYEETERRMAQLQARQAQLKAP